MTPQVARPARGHCTALAAAPTDRRSVRHDRTHLSTITVPRSSLNQLAASTGGRSARSSRPRVGLTTAGGGCRRTARRPGRRRAGCDLHPRPARGRRRRRGPRARRSG
ncbi:hypothetical protein GB931_03170 [Modestobacter sp. I12A-02628]|nr:hypothetical protein [Goekera deserti]